MKIIIPLAGHSRRFQQAGYAVPKPFIDIDGKPMIERVCRMFSQEDEFIFVCQKEHLKVNHFRSILETCVPNTKIVEIDPHELGPVQSVLSAVHLMADNEPVIISYCDFHMAWSYRQFLLKAEHYDGAIPVFRGFQPASFGDTYYAYLKANDDMEMLELREKKSFTENRAQEFASTGVYYFDRWSVFAKYAREILGGQETVGSEYYCSLLYNPMVRDGLKVALYEVDKFICWGTPHDLQEYKFWSNYFKHQAKKAAQKELIND